MPLDYAHTGFDRWAAAVDRRLLLTFDRKFEPVVQALKELPHELRRPALQLMEGLHRVKRDDRDKAALIAAAERCDHRPNFRYRAAAFFIAMGGVLEAVIQTFNDISRQSRAALGGYLVAADQGQRPSKAGFECADSRCGTEASGESHGDAFGHRSPGILDAIAPGLDGLGEGARKTLRLAVGAGTPWINVAPHFDCAALKRVYEVCRKVDSAGARTAYERDDEAYGRHHEWLVRTVEERICEAGFGVYEDLGLVLPGSDDEKFIDAMAVELGLVVGRMTTDYLQVVGGGHRIPTVVVSHADPGRAVFLYCPSRRCFHRLPEAAFPWPFYLSGVDRALGVGASRDADAGEGPRAWTFPALMSQIERLPSARPRTAAAGGRRSSLPEHGRGVVRKPAPAPRDRSLTPSRPSPSRSVA
jgi:hypothetical protein